MEDAVSTEPEFNAFYRCAHCHGLKAKADVIFCDSKPICRVGDCREAFYASTRPVAVPKSYARYEHG